MVENSHINLLAEKKTFPFPQAFDKNI